MNRSPDLRVILVGPEQAANVGFTARTLACYGLSGLRIVGSPGIATDGAAFKTGKAALPILESAAYYPSLESAVADCGAAYGFTRRTRDPAQRIEDLSRSAASWRAHPGDKPAALVFGRESQGLNREETLLLTHLVRIPMPAETLSLNLSHAVAIGLYAFLGDSPDPVVPLAPGAVSGAGFETGSSLASRAEATATLELLFDRLEAGGFFKGGKQEAQREYVRLLWQRLRPDRRELDFLAGILKNLAR